MPEIPSKTINEQKESAQKVCDLRPTLREGTIRPNRESTVDVFCSVPLKHLFRVFAARSDDDHRESS